MAFANERPNSQGANSQGRRQTERRKSGRDARGADSWTFGEELGQGLKIKGIGGEGVVGGRDDGQGGGGGSGNKSGGGGGTKGSGRHESGRRDNPATSGHKSRRKSESRGSKQQREGPASSTIDKGPSKQKRKENILPHPKDLRVPEAGSPAAKRIFFAAKPLDESRYPLLSADDDLASWESWITTSLKSYDEVEVIGIDPGPVLLQEREKKKQQAKSAAGQGSSQGSLPKGSE
ncbi:hypothetical protein HK102_008316 [Quaeritorhiza haematococci]|nr:hypothetical protein HK102_008316 [Quaeritorhiza haematococci]